jgi:4'-phosphopantetheinyl transferase
MAQSPSSKQFPVLTDDQVHVWRIPLNHSSQRTLLALEVLSTDERERAARFHFDKDRDQFVQARSALRFILGKYLNVRPHELEFSYGAQGKPALANVPADSKLRFNLSRRDGLALLALSRGREIGVDVELIRDDLPFFKMADVSFSPAEITTLHSLPESMRSAGFYNCWTRKEAYIKACGGGMQIPLDSFRVAFAAEATPALAWVRDDSEAPRRWRVFDVSDHFVERTERSGPSWHTTSVAALARWNLRQDDRPSAPDCNPRVPWRTPFFCSRLGRGRSRSAWSAGRVRARA